MQEGDEVVLDIPARQLNVMLTEEELTDRRANWQPLPPNYTTGALAKYAKLASLGVGGCGDAVETCPRTRLRRGPPEDYNPVPGAGKTGNEAGRIEQLL